MEPVSVKAILTDHEGRVLFARNPRDEFELPGGRPEPSESLEAALIREVREECGLEIIDARYLGSRSCEIVPGKRVLLVFFRCTHSADAPILSHEHSEFRWVNMRATRSPSIPEFYWEYARQALALPSQIEAHVQGLDTEYPLNTGEADGRASSAT
jgi:8-oxo-dGTP pyrophosphatase MutT (NUDIX family)